MSAGATSVAETVLPSVVTISAAAPGGQAGTGSGELFRDGGYVLTNQHVIAPDPARSPDQLVVVTLTRSRRRPRAGRALRVRG